MLIPYSSIQSKDASATDALKQSFAILRFYTVEQNNELIAYLKSLLATILANISESTCQIKLYLDILAKEHLELLLPRMRRAFLLTKDRSSATEPTSVAKMTRGIELMVRNRTGIIDEQLDLKQSKAYLVSPYVSEPEFRDVEQALTFLQEIEDANESGVKKREKAESDMLSVYSVLHAKHRNLAIAKSKELRRLLDSHRAAEKALNACRFAKILRIQCNLRTEQDVESFLKQSDYSIMNASWDALEQYYQQQEGLHD